MERRAKKELFTPESGVWLPASAIQTAPRAKVFFTDCTTVSRNNFLCYECSVFFDRHIIWKNQSTSLKFGMRGHEIDSPGASPSFIRLLDLTYA